MNYIAPTLQMAARGEAAHVAGKTRPSATSLHIKSKFPPISIGCAVEVFSKSRQKWISGKVTQITANQLCVRNGRKFHKWMACESPNYRLAGMSQPSRAVQPASAPQSVRKTKIPKLSQSSTSSAEATASSNMYTVGCEVELFSLSSQKWSISRVIQIEGERLRVVYGRRLQERWVLMASCRPHHKSSDEGPATKDPECSAAVRPSSPSGTLSSASYSFIDTESILKELDEADQMEMEREMAASQQSLRRNPMAMNAERGALRFKVHGAMELKSGANYATVSVGGMKLRTSSVESEENPIWKDVLIFNKFRPDIGKTATIKVKKHKMMGPVVVGSAVFSLPTAFGRHKKLVVELRDSQNNIAGLVDIEHSITRKGRAGKRDTN